jgi:hypothetical protein
MIVHPSFFSSVLEERKEGLGSTEFREPWQRVSHSKDSINQTPQERDLLVQYSSYKRRPLFPTFLHSPIL